MKLIELAKKNLQEYISVKETLELISTTQQTPLSYVATFLISQSFETNVPTYDADKYYSIHSNDDWNWGVFQYTNSILSNLADNEIYKDAFTFSGNDLPENLENTYWKRKELYNLELIKNLSIDFYFRVQDIKIIAQHTSYDSKSFDSKEFFSDIDVRKLLKNGISSYMLGSAEKYNLIDDFVLSSLGFFECNFDKGFEIKRDDLEKLFFDNQIIIKGFNDFLPKSSQSNNNIWDKNYLSLLELDIPEEYVSSNAYDISSHIDEFLVDINESETKKYPLFFKNDVFTVQESACLISNYDPYLVGNKSRKVVWLDENPRYAEAENFIYSAVRGGLFEEVDADFYVVRAEILKNFLSSKEILIDGFNQSLPTQKYTGFGQPLIQPAELSTENLNAEILRLRQIITEKDIEIKKLKQDIEKEKGDSFDSWLDQAKAEKEANELQERIKKLEEDQAVEKSESNNLLALILDESATERYAPDLVSSIMLWKHTYITSPKDDSHSNKADTWLKHNTGYDTAKKAGSASKIREVTAPFIKWSTHRDKAYKKINTV